jgi:hypothetical protein
VQQKSVRGCVVRVGADDLSVVIDVVELGPSGVRDIKHSDDAVIEPKAMTCSVDIDVEGIGGRISLTSSGVPPTQASCSAKLWTSNPVNALFVFASAAFNIKRIVTSRATAA